MKRKILYLCAVVLATLAILQTVRASGNSDADSGHADGAVPRILDILVDRSDQDVLLLATRKGLHALARDGTVTHVSTDDVSLWELAPHPTNPKIYFAAGTMPKGGRSRALISSDGGKTWRPLKGSGHLTEPIRSVALQPDNPNALYVFGKNISLGTVGGGNWRETGAAPPRAIEFAVSSLQNGRMFAATGFGLMISTNAGRTWYPVMDAVCRQPATAVTTTETGAVIAFNLCGGLMRGDEQTGAWRVIDSALKGCLITALAVSPRNPDRIFALARCNAILESADGGYNWRKFGPTAEEWAGCAQNSEGSLEADEGSE